MNLNDLSKFLFVACSGRDFYLILFLNFLSLFSFLPQSKKGALHTERLKKKKRKETYIFTVFFISDL